MALAVGDTHAECKTPGKMKDPSQYNVSSKNALWLGRGLSLVFICLFALAMLRFELANFLSQEQKNERGSGSLKSYLTVSSRRKIAGSPHRRHDTLLSLPPCSKKVSTRIHELTKRSVSALDHGRYAHARSTEELARLRSSARWRGLAVDAFHLRAGARIRRTRGPRRGLVAGDAHARVVGLPTGNLRVLGHGGEAGRHGPRRH